MKELGVFLPSGTSPQDLVRFGWFRPILRIRIPDEFYAVWKSYPVLQFDDAEDAGKFEWIFRLYGISGISAREATRRERRDYEESVTP